MRKNGFTLIELLAVIVILAIIALIATPIILGIISDAKEKANERSVELYASAVRNAVAAYQLTGTNTPTSFEDLTIDYDGDVKCDVKELYGDGSFYLDGCTVNNGEKTYSYGAKQGDVSVDDENACNLSDKDGDGVASFSDIITCGSESFYVIKNENDKITMLSMYNLYAGNMYRTALGRTSPIENPSGKQKEMPVEIDYEYDDDEYIYYGVVSFSSEPYWLDDDNNLLQQYRNGFVYDNNSNLYQYITNYQQILNHDLGVKSAETTLISYELLLEIYRNGNPSWLYSTNYWGGTYDEEEERMVLAIEEDEWKTDSYNYGSYYGIRPVITISASEL